MNYAAPVACAPTVAYAPAPVAMPTAGAVQAWGRPVWKKKWLLGKWQYAGIEDVQYVPTAAPMAIAPTVCAPTVCAPPAQVYAQEYTTTACAAPTVSYGGACATGYNAGVCAPGQFAGGYAGGCY